LLNLAALLCLTTPIQDSKEVTKDWKHPWADASVGTWVKYRLTHYQPSQSGGYEEKSTERKETVMKVSKSFLEIESKEGDSEPMARRVHTGLPGELNYKMTRAGEEEVKVGDRTYACVVYEFRTGPVKKGGKDGGQLLKVWKAAGAPSWAVKQRFWLDAQKEDGWTDELTGAETLKTAGKEYACAVVRKTTTMKAGRTPIQSVETTWRNPEVPGGFVKRVEQKIMNGKEQKNMESATLLLEFGTK